MIANVARVLKRVDEACVLIHHVPVSDSDWHITATEEEKRQLTCLFDQTLPPQLEINAAGRVTLGGTSSRLRDDHSTRAAVITQMMPGTAFTVTGNPHCEDGYRWWQIQLENGTVGWAAEATATEYYLEPLNQISTPTPIPSSPLRLTSMCSPDPASIRVWRVRNPNPDPVTFTWDVVGTTQTGTGTVPCGTADTPGEVTFQTTAVANIESYRVALKRL